MVLAEYLDPGAEHGGEFGYGPPTVTRLASQLGQFGVDGEQVGMLRIEMSRSVST